MKLNSAEFKSLYPFSGKYFIQPNGFKQHYLDEGNGTPFIMVHGNPSWSFLYRNMVKEFRKDHRVIVPDHIGCGLSDKPDLESFSYKLEDHIQNLETLIESFNFTEPVNLAVHDWGGAIGMGYAVRYPEKIKRLVIMNTAAFRLPHDCPFPWPIWIFRNTDLGVSLNKYCNAFSFIASHTCSIKGMPRNVRHGFRLPYNSPENRVATTRFVQDIPLTESDPSYQTLVDIENNLELLKEKPTIICFGRKDFVFSRHFYNEWRLRFPKAQAHNFHAGHYLLEDVGHEVFALVRQFLAKNP